MKDFRENIFSPVLERQYYLDESKKTIDSLKTMNWEICKGIENGNIDILEKYAKSCDAIEEIISQISVLKRLKLKIERNSQNLRKRNSSLNDIKTNLEIELSEKRKSQYKIIILLAMLILLAVVWM